MDARDNVGWTALMYAADKGYLLLVEELLAAQADVDIRAPNGAVQYQDCPPPLACCSRSTWFIRLGMPGS